MSISCFFYVTKGENWHIINYKDKMKNKGEM